MAGYNIWFLIVTLTSVGFFTDSARADDPKAAPARLVAQLGHSKSIISVAFSPNGKLVLTGSGDGTARLWDVRTASEIHVFCHGSAVLAVAFEPNSKQALTGGDDGIARLWDVVSGREVRKFTGHVQAIRSVAFSADGQLVLTGSADKTARLWEMASGRMIRPFNGHTAGVNAAVLSPDGKQVLTGSLDKTARLWDAANGKEQRILNRHTETIISVAFSPDGKQALTGSQDKSARLWDTKNGKEIHSLIGHTQTVRSISFSGDGKQLFTVSLDRTVRMWDVKSGKETRATTLGFPRGVVSMAFSPDQRLVLTGGDGEDNSARLWDVLGEKEMRRFRGPSSWVDGASFSRDGRRILTVSADAARLWDLKSGKELRAFPVRASVAALSLDGKRMLTGNQNLARLWDTASGQELRACTGHTKLITSLAFSSDGKQAVTGSWDKTARLWDIDSGRELRVFKGHLTEVNAVAFSPDGTQVLTGSDDKTARLWDARTGVPIRTFTGHTDAVVSALFSSDGKWVMTTSMDKTARLWDSVNGKEVRAFVGHTETVESAAFSRDGAQVLTGSGDGTARLWETSSGKELRRFTGHTDRVRAVSFSADDGLVLTGSWDHTTRLWDAKTGRERCTLISFDDGGWAVVDPDGRFDAANGGDVNGLHWVVGLETIALKQLKERYYEPGLLAKIAGFNPESFRAVERFGNVRLHPDVTFAEMKPGDAHLTFTVTNRGGGIGRVQVLVNRKELLADARLPMTDPQAASVTRSIDLSAAHVMPGQANTVEVVAYDAEGYLSSYRGGLTRDWTPPSKAALPPPDLYAIICGVSKYADPKLNLCYSAKDAEDIYRSLGVAGGRLFNADGGNRVHLILLATGDVIAAQKPSKENIRRAFESVARTAKPSDVLVVYLAGHGLALRRQGAEEYCYLTADARNADPMALAADPGLLDLYAVTSTELVEWIKKIPPQKQVMILDTCAAGAAKAQLGEHRAVSGDQERALDRLKDRTGFHVLMGCAADSVSYEASEYAQGLLTYSLLKAMAGTHLRDGAFLDVSTLFRYAADEVPQLAQDIRGIQKPIVMVGGGSFDIGQLTETDRLAIPLAKPWPMILRPKLRDSSDLGDEDTLKLTDRIEERLLEISSAAARGSIAPIKYVRDDKMSGAFRPTANYTVTGKKVIVNLVIMRDGQVVKLDGQTGNKITVEGDKDDLAGLAEKFVDAIRAAVKKP